MLATITGEHLPVVGHVAAGLLDGQRLLGDGIDMPRLVRDIRDIDVDELQADFCELRLQRMLHMLQNLSRSRFISSIPIEAITCRNWPKIISSAYLRTSREERPYRRMPESNVGWSEEEVVYLHDHSWKLGQMLKDAIDDLHEDVRVKVACDAMSQTVEKAGPQFDIRWPKKRRKKAA